MLDEFVQHLKQIEDYALFSGLNQDEIEQLLRYTGAEIKRYEKNSVVLPRGQVPDRLVIVLEGQLKTVYNSTGGQRNMAEKLSPSQGVALAYCILKTPLHMHVVAALNSTVLEVPCQRLLASCGERHCHFHAQVSMMIPVVLAGKAVALSEKTDYMQICSLRTALASYLLGQMYKTGRLLFTAVLNQTELADFLGVTRSALARELAHLRNQRLIEYHLNSYKILDVEGLQAVACTA